MKISVDIGSVTVEVREETLVICSKDPLRILSSAVLNGGLKEASSIVNVQVSEDCGNDKNDEHWNAEDFLKKHVAKLGLAEERTVGLMTAAKMRNVAVSHQTFGETRMATFVTAGTSIAVTAGEDRVSIADQFQPRKFGTINIVVLIDGNLTQSCMVDAVKTITEAKTVGLRELDVRSRFSGELASGTMTDGVAIACTGVGQPIRYAGTRTILGEFLGKAIREATKEAILRQENLRSDRQLSKRLEERNITLEEIIRSASSSSCKMKSKEEIQLIKLQMHELLSDQGVALLVLAGLRLDEDQKTTLLPQSKIASRLEESVLLSIIQNTFQAYKARTKNMSDSACNCLRADIAAEAKMGPLTNAIMSAVFREAVSRVDQKKN